MIRLLGYRCPMDLICAKIALLVQIYQAKGLDHIFELIWSMAHIWSVNICLKPVRTLDLKITKIQSVCKIGRYLAT